MGRFLLGVLLAVACIYGWQAWNGQAIGSPARAGATADGEAASGGPGGGGNEPASPPRTVGGVAPEQTPTAAPSAEAGVAAAGALGDPDAPSGRAGRLAALLGEAAAGAAVAPERWKSVLDGATPDDRLDALCSEGRFVLSEPGRLMADGVLEMLGRAPAATRLDGTQAMLEAVMPVSLAGADATVFGLVDRICAVHRRAADDVLCDPRNTAGAMTVEVQPGDSLAVIARRLVRERGIRIEGTGLAVLNGIRDPRRIRPGQVLRVPVDPIRTVVHKASFLLGVYVGDDLFRVWRIAHGKPGHETPETTFRIVAKIAEPDWNSPDGLIPYGSPENPLGTHFVKFEHPAGRYSGYGVHGTWAPQSIGTRASLGCVRLHNDHVAEYFALVPRGSTVEIR